MNTKKKYKSIPQVLQLLTQMENKALTLNSLLGYRSADIIQAQKSFITQANSVSIVFMQYDLNYLALDLLKRAAATDVELYKAGGLEDRLWEGRLVTYCNLAWLFLSIEKAKASKNVEYGLVISLLIFVGLWKIRRFRDSKGYIEQSARIINEVMFANTPCKFKKLALYNLHGIVSMALSGIIAFATGNIIDAVRTCDDAYMQLGNSNLAVKPLMYAFKNELMETGEKFVRSIQPRIDINKSRGSNRSMESSSPDILVTREMESILYVSIFIPFISIKTPIIKRVELEKAQYENRFSQLTREDLASLLAVPSQKSQSSSPQKAYSTQSSSRRLPHLIDSYTKRMTSAIKPSYPNTIPELPHKRRVVKKKGRLNTSMPSKLPNPRSKVVGGSNSINKNISNITVNRSVRVESDSLRSIFTHSETPRRVRSGTQRDIIQPISKRQPQSRATRTPNVRNSKLLYFSPNYQTQQLTGSVVLKPNFYNPSKKERHIMLEFSTSTSRAGRNVSSTPLYLETSFIEDSIMNSTFT